MRCRDLRGHSRWFEQLRALMDLKLYIEADADERIIRRIRRNMKQVEDCAFITDYYLESFACSTLSIMHQRVPMPIGYYPAGWLMPMNEQPLCVRDLSFDREIIL